MSFGLLAEKPFLWLAIFVLVAVFNVSPIGIAVGVSILPASIFSTLGWYMMRRRTAH
jgi:hypothetical protein